MNKTEKVIGFAIIFDEIYIAQLDGKIFSFNNTVYGRSLIVTSHV